MSRPGAGILGGSRDDFAPSRRSGDPGVRPQPFADRVAGQPSRATTSPSLWEVDKPAVNVADTERDLESVTEEKNQMSRTVQKLQLSLHATRAEVAARDAKLSTLTGENAELKEEMARREHEWEQLRLRYEEKIQGLARDLDRGTADAEQQQTQFEQQHNEIVNELELSLRERERELEGALREVDILRAQQKEANNPERFQQLEQHIVSGLRPMQERLDVLMEKNATLHEQLAEKVKQVASVQKQLAESDERVNRLEQDLKAADGDVREARDEADRLRRAMRPLEKEVESCRDKLRQTGDDFQSRLSKAQEATEAATRAMQSEVDRARQDTDILKQQLEEERGSFQARFEELEAWGHQRDSELQQIKKEAERYQGAVHRLEKERNDLLNEKDSAERDASPVDGQQLSQQSEDDKTHREQLFHRVAKLHGANARLLDKIRDLEGRLCASESTPALEPVADTYSHPASARTLPLRTGGRGLLSDHVDTDGASPPSYSRRSEHDDPRGYRSSMKGGAPPSSKPASARPATSTGLGYSPATGLRSTLRDEARLRGTRATTLRDR